MFLELSYSIHYLTRLAGERSATLWTAPCHNFTFPPPPHSQNFLSGEYWNTGLQGAPDAVFWYQPPLLRDLSRNYSVCGPWLGGVHGRCCIHRSNHSFSNRFSSHFPTPVTIPPHSIPLPCIVSTSWNGLSHPLHWETCPLLTCCSSYSKLEKVGASSFNFH